ncbi:MAG: hypothetical protein KZQ89_19330 [Candidatus Thiodiazotropha sp. (ex Lucinoma kastoroae)]|nr:hypothetical protein [Candidatus Thiodiazotropha sp. (ex Lucinoma kastoroae)]
MINAVYISIAALCISIAGFSFTLYQFRKGQFIKLSEKVNEVTKEAFELRRASQGLRDIIGVTDDVDDCKSLLEATDKVSEKLLAEVLRSPKIKLKEIYMAQQKIADLRLEIDLMHKQVSECKRFNEEFINYSR